jgi:drug/metabolite transporter (DMT)-like permease
MRLQLRFVSGTDLLLTFMALIWGVNYSVVKQTLSQMQPLAFNALRFSLASISLFLVLRLFEGGRLMRVGSLKQVFSLGVIGYCLHQILFIAGIAQIAAGLSALIMATSPIFVIVLNLFTRVEKSSPRILLGIILSLGGVLMLVIGAQPDSASTETLIVGGGLTLLSAICWASYTVLSKPHLASCSPLRLTTATMIFGTIILDIAAIPSLLTQQWDIITPLGWAGLAYSFVFTGVLGYVIWNIGVQRTGPARTAIYQNLTPVFAAVVSYILLGEVLSKQQFLGAGMILAGIYVTKTQQ